MNALVFNRHIITDEAGTPVGVILPMEEYRLVESILDQHSSVMDGDKVAQIEQAAHDPLFMQDLQDTMVAFGDVDAEWWEPA